MDTRSSSARARARGAAKPVLISVIAIFVLLAVAAWFLIIQPHQELVMQDAGGHPSTPVSSIKAAAPPPANVEAMDLNQLLSEARKAMNEGRLLAPAGNNAFEFYLKALEKQPGNAVATDALRETFPFAASAAEQTINDRNFNEAQRQIELLAKADPANYTLTILRSKLDAQRKLVDQEQQKVLDQQHQQELAAQKAEAEKAAADKKAEEARAQLVQQKAPANTASPAGGNAGGAAPTETVKQDVFVPAQVVATVNPRYPVQAQRLRREGYVDVEYTVLPDGSVDNVRVVDSNPARLFDREAETAIRHWRFKPATRNGQPISTKLTQHFVFSLGAGR